MSDQVQVTSHSVERLTVRLGTGYAQAVERFEQLVPAAPLERFRNPASWEEVESLLKATPLGFMRYGTIDSAALLAPSGITRQSVEYLVGNHALAETMFRRQPAIILYAPLRVTFHADDDGQAIFAVDRPSDLFGSFQDPELARTGRLIDAKIAGILGGLGVPAPASLVHQDAMA
jgi:hypothetical protein